jgi:ElaA protein
MTPDDAFEIFALRTSVFYLEQQIDEEELDDRDRDEATTHLWIRDGRGAAAYLRVVENPHPQPGDRDARRLIGRVVRRVFRTWACIAPRGGNTPLV